MTVSTLQETIVTGVLYKLEGQVGPIDQVRPSIEVIGGTVDIYGAQKLPTSAPTGMYKTATAFTGIDQFNVVPNYLYLTGSATSIILSGISATVV